MTDSISSDGRGVSPPDRPVSFLIVDSSGVIDDALADMLLSQQASLRITKDMQQAAKEIRKFPAEHRSFITNVENVEQLLSVVSSRPESYLTTFVIIVGNRKKGERTIADLYRCQ